MRWYRGLYLGEGLEDKKEKLIEKIEKSAGTPGIYVVTLAANGTDLFDIFSTDYLLQPVLHGHCPMVVGLCKGYEEAVEMATSIALEGYRETGSFAVLPFLKGRLTEGEELAWEYPSEHLRLHHKISFAYLYERLRDMILHGFKRNG
ncbi:MAG: hypothetical protein Q4B57_08995 [Eubacteriales bacterium]|nr:hypothetical protein [Eubacteriales bacterium]